MYLIYLDISFFMYLLFKIYLLNIKYLLYLKLNDFMIRELFFDKWKNLVKRFKRV